MSGFPIRFWACLSGKVAWLCLFGLVVGCAQTSSLPLSNPLGSLISDPSDDVYEPHSVVAIWSEAALQRAAEPTIRGFGARLLFYREGSDAPVRVEGSLVVYAYDQARDDANDPASDRKYLFTQEEFAEHYSESKVGHSYSIWLPWGEAGGPRKEVDLIVRFNPSQGPSILSRTSKVGLPGNSNAVDLEPEVVRTAGPIARKAARTQAATRALNGSTRVRQVAYEDAIGRNTPYGDTRQTKPKMTTTTIRVPSQFGRPRPIARGRRTRTRNRTRASRSAVSTPNPDGFRPTPRAPRASADSRARLAEEGSSPARPRSADSPPVGRPAPSESNARSTLDRAPWQPIRGAWPSRL